MRALRRPVRPIFQAFESVALIARQPPVHRSPRHAPVSRHLAHCPTVAYYCQDRLVPLLSHAHLPHVWERDKSAEVGVTHQPKVCNPSAECLLGPVSRTCTTIGSGVLSRLTTDSSVPVDTRHSHSPYGRGAVPLACSLRTWPLPVRATVLSNSLPTQNCSRPSVTSTSQELPA